MASVNKVIILGNLGRDPDTRYLASGEAVANLAIATSEKYKDKNGEMVEHTEWHRVVFFGRIAEVCEQYLRKGSSVYVEGSLRTNKYEDPKTGEMKYSTEIRGFSMQMLGGGGDREDTRREEPARRDAPRRDEPRREEPRREQPRREEPAPRRSGSFDDMDDDIPF